MNKIMPNFKRRLDGVFAKADEDGRRAVTRAKSDAVDNMRNNRFAFVLLDALDGAFTPRIHEALTSYDLAINRPFPPREAMLEAIRGRVRTTYDAVFAAAIPPNPPYPMGWIEIAKRDKEARRERLVGLVDQHATGLAGTGVSKEYKPWWDFHPVARALLFVVGTLIAAVIASYFSNG